MYPDNTVGTSKRTGAGPVDSFDVNSTVIFPILGGIIAGVIVILFEWSFRALYEWNQRKRGTKDISRFFGNWEDAINTSADLGDNPSGVLYAKDQIQFVMHRYYVRAVHFTISRWSKYLSDQQTEEINLLVFRHEHSVIGSLPPDRIFSQEIYDRFFCGAREIKWLKF